MQDIAALLLPIRRLDRYIMRQFWISYLICSCSIIGLFMVLEGLSRLGKFLGQDQNLLIVFALYYAATVPVYFSQYLGPVLTLIAGMFTVTLINKGNELTPMKAAGMSIARSLGPIFLVAVCLAAAQITIQEWILPNSKDFIRRSTALGRKRNTIRPELVNDDRNDLLFDVKEYIPHEKHGKYVRIVHRYPETRALKMLIQAEDLVWEHGRWMLYNGSISYWSPDAGLDHEQSSETFEKRPIDTDLRPIDLESSDQEVPYFSYRELLQQYRRRPELNHLEVKLHQRFAFPLANLILLLLGLPFVIRERSKSVILGVMVAMLISAAYLLSTTICADLGNRGFLTPAVAAWLPVLFFGALGFTIFDGVET